VSKPGPDDKLMFLRVVRGVGTLIGHSDQPDRCESALRVYYGFCKIVASPLESALTLRHYRFQFERVENDDKMNRAARESFLRGLRIIRRLEQPPVVDRLADLVR